MEPRRLTEVEFDRIADSNDLQLVQSLRRTAVDLERRGIENGEAGRLRDEVTGLLETITFTTGGDDREDTAGERFQRFDRFYNDDQELVDRTRAALMAYGDRPTDETAAMAADAVAELREQH